MLKGYSVNIKGTEYMVPPLSLGLLRSGALDMLREHDKLVEAGDSFGYMELRGKIILLALRRNYPEFPEEMLFDFLDLSNVGTIWLSILGASGFSPGEEVAAAKTEEPGT